MKGSVKLKTLILLSLMIISSSGLLAALAGDANVTRSRNMQTPMEESSNADVTRYRNLQTPYSSPNNADVIRYRNLESSPSSPNNADVIRFRNMQFSELQPTVTFIETGLPSGATWTVAFNGLEKSTSDGTIYFNAIDGEYPFSIASTSGLEPSPASSGTIRVKGDTIVAMEFGTVSFPVVLHEVGLPEDTGWSATYGPITQTSTSESITFTFYSPEACQLSASCPGYIAQPSPIDINNPVSKSPYGTGTNIMFIPDSNPHQFSTWNPIQNSYFASNFASVWASGNCYGFSSTSLLYFMHYVLGENDYPYFPSQLSEAQSTSDLDLSGVINVCPPQQTTLNNASLAIMFHQVYDPSNHFSPWESSVANEKQQFSNLLASLENGRPVVLAMGSSTDPIHSVVAWAAGQIKNENWSIAVYDPNYPESTQIAICNASSGDFSYNTPGSGLCDHFVAIDPTAISASWAPLEWWNNILGSYWWLHHWLDLSVANYNIVIADKMVTITSNDLTDYFTAEGNSSSFVCGIPDSSGIEEGSVQVYAIPLGTDFSISDPGTNHSEILITSVSNASGQLEGRGYFLNATTEEGFLNYTATLLNGGLSMCVGADPINASVRIFECNQQGYFVSDILTAQIDSGQSINLTAPCAASFTAAKNVVGKGYPLLLNASVSNSGNNPENASLTLFANTSILSTETVLNVLSGTSVNLTCIGNTSDCVYGEYFLSIYCQPSGLNEVAMNFTFAMTLIVTFPGDINGDFTVNIYDAILLAGCFNSYPSSLHWNPNTDINSDDIVVIFDALILSGHYNQHYP